MGRTEKNNGRDNNYGWHVIDGRMRGIERRGGVEEGGGGGRGILRMFLDFFFS